MPNGGQKGYAPRGRKHPFYYSVDGVKIAKPVMATNQKRAMQIIKIRIGNNSKIEFRKGDNKPIHYSDFSTGYHL